VAPATTLADYVFSFELRLGRRVLAVGVALPTTTSESGGGGSENDEDGEDGDHGGGVTSGELPGRVTEALLGGNWGRVTITWLVTARASGRSALLYEGRLFDPSASPASATASAAAVVEVAAKNAAGEGGRTKTGGKRGAQRAAKRAAAAAARLVPAEFQFEWNEVATRPDWRHRLPLRASVGATPRMVCTNHADAARSAEAAASAHMAAAEAASGGDTPPLGSLEGVSGLQGLVVPRFAARFEIKVVDSSTMAGGGGSVRKVGGLGRAHLALLLEHGAEFV
jgi:hypothetical protein